MHYARWLSYCVMCLGMLIFLLALEGMSLLLSCLALEVNTANAFKSVFIKHWSTLMPVVVSPTNFLVQ